MGHLPMKNKFSVNVDSVMSLVWSQCERVQWLALLIVEDGGCTLIFAKVTNPNIIKVSTKAMCINRPPNQGTYISNNEQKTSVLLRKLTMQPCVPYIAFNCTNLHILQLSAHVKKLDCCSLQRNTIITQLWLSILEIWLYILGFAVGKVIDYLLNGGI